MSRSRNAAVVMLIGAFAAGGAAGYVGAKYSGRTSALQPTSGSQRSGDQSQRQLNMKNMVYKDLEMDEKQQKAWDSLIAARRIAVEDLFTIPRAKQDSINADTRVKQRALLRPDQLAKLDARIAEMKLRSAQRRKEDSLNKSGKSKTNPPRQ